MTKGMEKQKRFENACLRLLAKERENVSRLEQELKSIRAIDVKCKEVVELLTKQNAEYTRMLTEAINRKNVIQKHFDKATARVENLKEDVADLKQTVRNYKDENHRLEKENQEHKDKNWKLETEKSRLVLEENHLQILQGHKAKIT